MITIPIRELADLINIKYGTIIHYLGHFTLFKYCISSRKNGKGCKAFILNQESINALGNYLFKKKRSIDEIDDLVKYYKFQKYKESLC